MDFELKPLTSPGKEMVVLAEQHAADFAAKADQHDREGTFPVENIKALQQSGLAAAPVPPELGGMGVTSAHDCIVAVSRLARGDASTPLAFTMHLFQTFSAARNWRIGKHRGDQAAAERWEKLLRRIGAGECIITVCNAEPGADVRNSRTEAKRVDGGWLVNGSKSFATGSPAADILSFRCRFQDDSGNMRLGIANIASDAPGVEIKYDWAALGMRASGSHDVEFKDCFVDASDLDDIGEFGKYANGSLGPTTGTILSLTSVFLGIAESAHHISLETIAARGSGGQPMNQIMVAENETDIAACRAMLGRSACHVDEFLDAYPNGGYPSEETLRLFKDGQCTKLLLTRKAIEIVDRTVTLSGGPGYLSRSPLSRLYRDVRAGPIMQPFSSFVAPEFIGKVAMGVDPDAS